MKKVAILYSGGLDSTAMLFNAVKQYGSENIVAIYSDFWQRNSKEEKQSFNYFTEKLGIKFRKEINIKQIFEDVPNKEVYNDPNTPDGTRKMYNRNMVLISCATAKGMQMNCDKLLHGAHYSDAKEGYPDCSENFYNSVKNCVFTAYPWFKIEMPLINKTKGEVIKWAIESGMTKEDIPHTWSCYHSSTGETYEVDGIKYLKPCRKCVACKERYENGLLKIFPDIY